jgi:carbon starvation protein CstA
MEIVLDSVFEYCRNRTHIGAIAGALWGPAAFIWIVFGTIFAGGVHDYFSGMLSMRHNGLSIPEIVGVYLGPGFKQFLRGFTVILLLLVGVVFVAGPAQLLNGMVPGPDIRMWLAIIFVYYIIATLLPVDKLIGRLYPIFGAALFLMAIGITGGIVVKGYTIPEVSLENLHPAGLPIWPLMFITIACGAISGFHSTQSPIMARCCSNELLGKRVFYGAMVAEGIVALIWAAASMAFFGSTAEISAFMSEHGQQAGVVNHIATSFLGPVGGVLAVVGVVLCPVSSGDTAFRSAR